MSTILPINLDDLLQQTARQLLDQLLADEAQFTTKKGSCQ